MGLSQPQKNKIDEHLRGKLRAGCPICGERDFLVDPTLQFHGILDTENKQPVEGSVFPIVSVICNNCYYTFQLAAMRFGIL